MHNPIYSLEQPYKGAITLIFISQVKKLPIHVPIQVERSFCFGLGRGSKGGCEGEGKAPGNRSARRLCTISRGTAPKSRPIYIQGDRAGRKKKCTPAASPLSFSAVSLCFTQEISRFASREVWAAPSPAQVSGRWLGSWGRREQKGRDRGAAI